MVKIAVVCVPYTPNRESFLLMEQTMSSLLRCKTSHTLDLIAIINKGSEDIEFKNWLTHTFNHYEYNNENSLALAWNKGIKLGFSRSADYCLVINLDLLFHESYIENLIAFAKSTPEAIMWSGCDWPDDETLQSADLSGEPSRDVPYSAFLIDKRLFEIVGEFDEIFKPAYHEDSDMNYRIRLKNHITLKSPSAACFHYATTTILSAAMNNDEEELRKIEAAVSFTNSLYLQKWGGSPGEEKYPYPYNRPLL